MLDRLCVVTRSSKRQSDEIKESNFGHDEQEWGFKDDSEVWNGIDITMIKLGNGDWDQTRLDSKVR